MPKSGRGKSHSKADPSALVPAEERTGDERSTRKISNAVYEKELRRLEIELVKLQAWIQHEGLRVVVIFEGRDAAGKGGVIKRLTEFLNPRHCRVIALPKPSDRERTQWYFQRYVAHLPAAGELVLYDRSWYNRAGVERVMGYCTPEEYREFLRACPQFERMLVRSGMKLIKYWFSISAKEQERRFRNRIKDPLKKWKLSTVDFESRARWVDYSRAKDDLFVHTDSPEAPWYVVNADCKKRARLNCISHLLSQFDYKDVLPNKVELPPLQVDEGYVRPPLDHYKIIPEPY